MLFRTSNRDKALRNEDVCARSTAGNPITVGTETVTYSNQCECYLKASCHAGQITNCNPIPDCYLLKVQLGDEKTIICDIKHEGDGKAARKIVGDIQGGLKGTCSGTTSRGSKEEFEYDTSIVVNAGSSNRLEPAKLVFNPTGDAWYGEGGDLSSIDIDISSESEAVDDGINELMCGLIIAGLAAAAQWALLIGLLAGINFGAPCDPSAEVTDWIGL
ncbi:hypothetical protein DL768_004234 [Monosporascus sp. mg162]|nr:hypothetical protein DL768_004234 [Monosporascus sp. mg162]